MTYIIEQVNPRTQERKEVFRGTWDDVYTRGKHQELINNEIQKCLDKDINPFPYYWLYTEFWYQVAKID